LLSVSLATLFLTSPPASSQGTAYTALTNTYRNVTNFNVETTRGMVLRSSLDLISINTHGSALNYSVFGGQVEPDFVWATLNNPIAVAEWTTPDEQFAVVLGGASHALALHDITPSASGVRTGRIVGSVQLPGETGDLVVHQASGQAFASCPGVNQVLQIDLASMTIMAKWDVASQRPRFLFLDSSGPSPVVYVAPELSGNNTTTSASVPQVGEAPNELLSALFFLLSPYPNLAPALVTFQEALAPDLSFNVPGTEVRTKYARTNALPIDLDLFGGPGLPDEDLFRIDPVSIATTITQSALPVLRRAGTLLMAHARHPSTGEYWMIGTESFNADPYRLSEPSLRGGFAQNRLTISATLGAPPMPGAPPSPTPSAGPGIDLDAVQGGYSKSTSIGFPYALTFDLQNGNGLIAASGSDRIRVTDSSGARIGEFDLPTGSIPRQLLIDPGSSGLFVYCWGTNTILVYALAEVYMSAQGSGSGQVVPLATIPIGNDPLDDSSQRGRQIFYATDNSLDGRTSCNHCHPGGGMDLLGWSIRDFPHDHKDIMVTQSLKGIEDTFPYHWRGERDLEAFNVAFEGLLGGELLPDGDLEAFKMFIFSMQVHANPLQSMKRELIQRDSTMDRLSVAGDGSSTAETINLDTGSTPNSADAGQTAFLDPDTLLSEFSCADCHGFETGSIGGVNFDDLAGNPHSLNMDVAHLRQLFHKTQDIVEVQVGTTMTNEPIVAKLPRGGFGLSHDGDHASTLDFLTRNPFAINEVQRRNLSAFVEQFDQGIAPAAHAVFYLDSSTPEDVMGQITIDYLSQEGTPNLASDWVDFVAIGSHVISGVTVDLTWSYNQSGAIFTCDDPNQTFNNGSTGQQTWEALQASITAGEATFLLIGLPPGNGFRFAHDHDNDKLINSLEPAGGERQPDFDGDSYPDGHEYQNPGMNTPINVVTSTGLGPVDTSVLGSMTWRVDHMGATYAKLVLEFDEPVQLEVMADNQMGHTTNSSIERRLGFSDLHTITVQRLRPSIPSKGYTLAQNYPIVGPTSPTSNVYTYAITATDLSLNQTTFTITPPQAPTRDMLVVEPFLDKDEEVYPVSGPLPVIDLARVIDSSAWTVTAGTNNRFEADFTSSARFTPPEVMQLYNNPPNTPNQALSPDHKQIVILQALYQAPGGAWAALPRASNAAGALAIVEPSMNSNVFETLTFAPIELDIPGPFILSDPSNPQGVSSVALNLTQPLPADSKLRLNVIGIVERDSANPSALPNAFDFAMLKRYQLPATPGNLRYLEYAP